MKKTIIIFIMALALVSCQTKISYGPATFVVKYSRPYQNNSDLEVYEIRMSDAVSGDLSFSMLDSAGKHRPGDYLRLSSIGK